MSRANVLETAAVAQRDGAALVLTREAMRFAVPVAAVLVLGAFALRGTEGGLTALVAAGALLAIQYASGWATGTASKHGPHALQAVTMFGVLARLALYAVLLAVLRDVPGLDVAVMATVVVTLTVVILSAEARMALRHAPMWWTQAEGTAPAAATAGAPDRKDRT